MNKFYNFFTGALLSLLGSNAFAHPGHEVTGIIGQTGHSFSLADYMIGTMLVSYLIYKLIKKTL